MKFFAVVAALSLVARLSSGCEYHRRLEEARRQRQAMQQVASDRLRHSGHAQLRQSIYGDRDGPYSRGSYGESRSDDSPSYRTANYRLSSSSYPTTHIHHSSSSSIPISSLPANSRFCPGSTEYYCDVSAECVKDDTTSAWKCRYVQTHTVHRRPVITYNGGREREHRHYSGSLPYRAREGGSYIPNFTTRTRYTCGTGLRRVNITSSSFRCEDIDECETEANQCEGSCKNVLGSFYCSCDRGFVRDGKYGCRDKDECAHNSGFCGIATCVNTEGSFECICPDGYENRGHGRCEDVNECEELNPCEEGEICFNKWGNYSCDEPHECPEGYMRSTTSDSPDSKCFLQGGTSANSSQATSISYRKILVEARKYPDSSRALGTMRFSSPNNMYIHSYSVKVLEGGENFRYEKRSPPYRTNVLIIEFFNRGSLNPDEEYQFSLLITDRPRRYRNHYGSYDRIPESRRKVAMTIVPQVHGN